MTVPSLSSRAVAAGSSQTRSEALPSPRFLHAVAAGQPQEAALAVWWRRFHDPELDALIEATLQQGYATSSAALRLRQASERSGGLPGETAAETAAEDAAGDDAALYDFYTVRLRQLALTARHYFQALCLHERIACADAAIAAGSAMLRRAAARGDADNDAGMEAAGISPLADLHAHRIRLSAQWDAIAIALAYQVAQPLAGVVARLRARSLPAAAAESPAIGGPDRLRLRRPDLCALSDVVVDASSDPWAARMAALVREQRAEQACSEVELALAALAGAQNELVPVRAALASAEAQYKRLRTSADPRHIAEAAYAVHACRDREIETRGRGYLALVDLFHAAGCGWPVLSDPALADEEPQA